MSTQALTADAKVLTGVTYVSSALGTNAKAYLDSAFAADSVVRFEATGAGAIEVCTQDGKRIGFCPPESACAAVLDDTGTWRLFLAPAAPAALVPNGTDLTTTQTLANALKAIMISAGFMKAE